LQEVKVVREFAGVRLIRQQRIRLLQNAVIREDQQSAAAARDALGRQHAV